MSASATQPIPIDVETTYIDANAPRQDWIHGRSAPAVYGITLRNVRTEGGSRLRLTGIDAEHSTEIRFDGVQTGGIDSMKQQLSNAQITLGPGPGNWLARGKIVRVFGAAGTRELPSCSDKFTAFPPINEH
jgi:hypothetical protein